MGTDSQGVIYSGIATPSSGTYHDILVRRWDAAAKKWVLVGGILSTTDSRLVGFAVDPTTPASPWVRACLTLAAAALRAWAVFGGCACLPACLPARHAAPCPPARNPHAMPASSTSACRWRLRTQATMAS